VKPIGNLLIVLSPAASQITIVGEEEAIGFSDDSEDDWLPG